VIQTGTTSWLARCLRPNNSFKSKPLRGSAQFRRYAAVIVDGDLKELAARWVAAQAHDPEPTEAEWPDVFAVQCLALDPEQLWLFVLAAEPLARGTKAFGMLAAGPLEDLIQDHGPAFIDRIELEAGSNSSFANLLHGVWVPASDDPVTLRYLVLGCDQVRPPA
jgi:hypothetical protein